MAPLEDERKLVFLVALREPRWAMLAMLAMLDFWTNTIDQVIDKVLKKDIVTILCRKAHYNS